MKVRDLGEFGLIDMLAGMVKTGQSAGSATRKNLETGIGDDAAVWRNAAARTLATTDCLVQDVHFKMGQTSWYQLGWKALAVNLSDVAAMGGTAEYALVTLGLPADTQVEDITELYQGLIEIGDQFGVTIAGGDITASEILFISIALTGSAGDKVLRRSGARAGDLIAVTGYPGAAAAGWRLISQGIPASADDAPLRQAFLQPVPRMQAGWAILDGGGHAAIDISDGLVADLGHICRASRVGAIVKIENIPLHSAAKRIFPRQALDLALGGGEDYELLFTASPATMKQIQTDIGLQVSVIGEIGTENAGQVRLLDAGGDEYHLKQAGWDHFGTT